jgi:mRNA interferase RelE/StbE
VTVGRYSVRYTEKAVEMIEAFADRRVRQALLDRADSLANEPAMVGKPLVGEFARYRSIRAVGQRYRLVYRVDETVAVVWVVAAGLRKQGSRHDIYHLLSRIVTRAPGK